MFVLIDKLILLCAVFVINDSAFVDKLAKCNSQDRECMKALFKTALLSVGTKGVPELDIPPIDPFHLKNVSISPYGIADITLVDIEVTGLKDCEFNSFSIELLLERANAEITCDITAKGHYKAPSSNSMLVRLLGGATITGDGKAKVKLSKVNVKFDLFLNIKKKDDGEVYVTFDSKRIHYKYDVLDKVTFDIDGLYMDKEDASASIKNLLNKNWRRIYRMAGSNIMDLTMAYVYKYTKKFFDSVPVKQYLTDDMTPYLNFT